MMRVAAIGLGGLALAAAVAVAGGLAPGAARAQTLEEQRATDYPRYNLQCGREPKAGIFACKYPGNFYGVSAYTRKKKPDRDDILALDRQVFMRAAQLALDNDRDYFTLVSDGSSNTFKEGKVKHVRGTAGYTLPGACSLNKWNVPTACSPGQEVAGTPGYSVQERGFIGRDTIARIFTAAEKASIDAGTFYGPPDDTMFDAEATYRRYRDTTEGRWPTLIALYQNRARRFEDMMGGGGATGQAARATAARTHLRLAALYGEAGDAEMASKSGQRASDLALGR